MNKFWIFILNFIILTDIYEIPCEKIDDTIKNNDKLLIWVTTKWCFSCKKEKKKINLLQNNFNKYIIDGDKCDDFKARYNIKTYPKYIFFIKTYPLVKNNNQDISNWVENLYKNNYKNDHIKSYICDLNYYNSIKFIFNYYKIDFNYNSKLCNKKNEILIVKKDKKFRFNFNNINELVKIIKFNQFNKINIYSNNLKEKILRYGWDFLIFYNLKLTDEIIINKIYNKFKNNFIFIKLNKYNEKYKYDLLNLGINNDKNEHLIIGNTIFHKKYRLIKEKNVKNISNFIDLYNIDQIQPFYMSEDLRFYKNINNTIKINSLNFEKSLKNNKNQCRILYIYNSDDKSSNNLLNSYYIYTENNKSSIKIYYYIDLKYNEVEGLELYPNFVCFPINSKKIKVKKDKSDLKSFINKCCGIRIKEEL